MMLDKTKLNDTRAYLEGDVNAIDETTAAVVANYKQDICKKYISLNPEQIETRLGGTSFYVTRKYDGELAVLFWDGQELFSVNTGGHVRMGLPCMTEAAKALSAAGFANAVIAAELHVDESAGRARVFDTLASLADSSKLDSLCLSPFDIISVDDAPFRASSYAEIHAKLSEIFADTERCTPVRCKTVDSKSGVKELFAAWVEEEGGEGLVVRSELPMIYKIKPRYTLDAAVIGFSEGTAEFKGHIRSLMLALMTEDGALQVIGHVGGGFGDELRKEYYERLMPMKTASSYIETDSNHVAFHMVRPEITVEININDVLFETTSGTITNPLLEYKDGAYKRCGQTAGISIVFPVFERERTDKAVNNVDVRLSQIDEIAVQPAAERSVGEVPKQASELLKRTVYKKEAGTKLMVQKFLVWKTNKRESGYPAYVLAYTNFSSERKDPLASELRISDDETQIMQFYDEFLEKNIKKGWVEV